MRENICTIPINDIFKETKSCPVCRMHNMIELQYVEYITGSAMMAPDVRVVTNQTGFCKKHSMMMLNNGPRLSNALIYQTHIDEIRQNILPQKENEFPSKKCIQKIKELKNSCYVCDRIEKDIQLLMKTVFAQFAKDEEFRRLYSMQEYICLDHYADIMIQANSKDGIDRKYKEEFTVATNRLLKNYINSLYDDLTHFTTMYDYRNQGNDWGTSVDSIERTITFLSTDN